MSSLQIVIMDEWDSWIYSEPLSREDIERIYCSGDSDADSYIRDEMRNAILKWRDRQ